jgi:hypothetical protein
LHWWCNVISNKDYSNEQSNIYEVKDTTESDRFGSYLDLHLEIDNEGRLSTKLYDNRDDINCPNVNFPLMRSTIPAAHVYGVYISRKWNDIRECVAPIRISVIEDTANTEATETRDPVGKGEIITSKMLRSPPWLGWPLILSFSLY